jgi:hypothetical protein
VSLLAETNQSRFRVEVSRDATPGPRLVRLYNSEGASDPRIFVVGAGPESVETEPNNAFSAAQALDALPVTVNGRLDKNGDVDSFAVRLRAGQWLDARLEAYTLMSKLDGVLRLVTTNGIQLAWNHDFTALDPRLFWQSTDERTVVLQVFGFKYPSDSSIQLSGGDGAVYRLHLNLTDQRPDAMGGQAPVHPEVSPASPLALPVALDGTLGAPDEVDHLLFNAEAGGYVAIHVEAESLGSPLDAWIKVEDPAGRQLAQNDDAEGSRDPSLEWQAPTDGTYVVALGSVTHRGGPGFRYRLLVQSVAPDFQGRSEASGFTLDAGRTNDLKLTVRRLRGHTNELRATFAGLPPDVALAPAPASIRVGNTGPVLKLTAATNAAAFSGPFRLLLTDTQTAQERAVRFELTSRGENNGVPQGYQRLLIEGTDQLWLTVRPFTASANPDTAAR